MAAVHSSQDLIHLICDFRPIRSKKYIDNHQYQYQTFIAYVDAGMDLNKTSNQVFLGKHSIWNHITDLETLFDGKLLTRLPLTKGPRPDRQLTELGQMVYNIRHQIPC